MKKIYFSICFLFFGLHTYSQNWDWAVQDTVRMLVVDSFGNIYAAVNDKIKRYNTEGNVLWQKQLDGDFTIKGMVTDSSGDLYIICDFYTFSFDSTNFLSSGQTDIFFGKIDSSGGIVWYKIFGDLGWEYVSDIFINIKQDIFICGSVGGGTIMGIDTFSAPEYFVARYKGNGNLDLLLHNYGLIHDNPREIGADSSGNIYLLGSKADYSDSIYFGNGIYFSPNGMLRDNYVVKINDQGISQWVKNLGTIYKGGNKYGLTVTKEGKFYLIESGYIYGFTLQQYDTSGNLIWTRIPNSDGCNAVYLDRFENIWIAGAHTEDYSGAQGIIPFVFKYNDSGSFLDSILETSKTNGLGIQGDKFNNFYLTGNFPDSQVFGNSTLYASHGSYFLAKLNANYPMNGINTTNDCLNLKIYPNPSTGIFTIEYCRDNVEENAVDIEIINSAGQQIFQKRPKVSNGCIREVIELEKNLPFGIYMVNVLTDKNITESRRIVLAK